MTTLLSGLGKTAIVLPASFLMNASNGLVNFGIIYYLRDTYGAEPSIIGWFNAFYSLAYFAGCLGLKPLLVRLLPRYSMMAASVLMATSTLGILLLRSLWINFFLYGFFGFAVALFWPPLMGWLSAEREGKDLNRTISRFNFSWSSANIVSPFLAGLLFETDAVLPIQTGIALQYGIFLFILAASLALPRLRLDDYREPAHSEAAGISENRPPLRFLAWTGIFGSYAMIGVLNTMFPLFGREGLSLSASVVGAILLTRSLTTTGGFMLFGAAHRWHFRVFPHFLAQGVYVLMAVLLMLVPRPLAYVLILPVFGLTAAYSYSSSIFHGAAGTPRRGRSMTIHEAVLTAGQVVGAVGGGFFYEAAGMTGALFFVAGLIFLGTLLQGVLRLRFRREAAELTP